MKVVGKCLGVACAAAMLLAVASVASAQLSDDDRKCSDKINNDARKVLQQEAKGNRKDCVKDQTGDVTTCINADRPKSTDKCAKLTADHADKCATLPAFGVNASPAAICDAVQEAADDNVRAVFGDPVDGLDASGCDDKMTQRPGQLAVAQWKAFRKCAKDLASIPNIAALEGCVASGIAAGTAAKGVKVSDDFASKCAGAEPAGAADGACGGTGANFDDCVIDNVECNTCLAINEVIGGSANCSAISGIACGVPSHKCTFDGATDNSELEIILAGGSFQTLNISGAIDITCDPATQDVNGKRDCDCDLQTFDPVQIIGIGFVCVDPAGPCPQGEMDCTGGNALGIDLRADHQAAGLCTSNADCDTKCATHCTGLGKSVFLAACEGFCQGGAQNDQPCNCDVQPAATCTTTTLDSDTCEDTVMGGTNAGSCEGKDDERGGGGQDLDCHCQCIDEGFHGAGAAGEMRCRLGTAIRVETNSPCDNVGVIVRLPPLCGPFSTQRATARIANANETGGTFVPPGGDSDQSGAEIACATFDTSTTAGMEIVGNLAFFDSTVGDLMSELRVDCQ